MSVYKGENVIAGGSVDTYFVRKPAWSQAESITIAQLNAGYTVPKDGMLVGYIHTTNASTLKSITVNNVAVAVAYGIGADISIAQFQVEVNASDTVAFPVITVNSASISFVPFEDSTIAEPEVVTPEYIRNQNILSDYENVTLPLTAQYDGELVVNTTTNSGLILAVNGAPIVAAVYSQGVSVGNSASLTIKKGDVISTNNNYQSAHARYYKLRDYRGR